MKRLFVAIDFPEAIKAQLKPLCVNLQGAKWVTQHQMHLTLRFIGDVDDEQLKQIQTGLATIRAAPFQMRLEGIGQFPPKDKPRVIWVGVKAEPSLNQLQQKIERVIRESGFEKADHPFSPHITLARCKAPPPIEQVERYFTHHQAFQSDTFDVSGFVLYSSQLSPSGSIYHQEGFYSLV